VIGRTVIVKVLIFTAVTVLGVGYVLVRYLGVGQAVVGGGYTAYVDLSDSGGIFTTASVTYRGVEVGKVGPIALRSDGIRVALDLNGKYKIPADTEAVIGNGSAIGEQYVDLQPRGSGGPYLRGGSVIPQSRTQVPVSTQQLLVSVDKLVQSLPQQDLRTAVVELGKAFQGTGPSIQDLLDASHALLTTAQENLPQTTALIDQSAPVLQTQLSLRDDLNSFSRDLSKFSDQLRASDTDLRHVIDRGTPAAVELNKLVEGVDVSLPVLLTDLVTFGLPISQRTAALRQVLIGYPYVIATTFGIFPGNGTRFGIPMPADNDVPPCTTGYIPDSQHRLPTTLSYPDLRYRATCLSSTQSGVGVRGARNAPEPGGGRLIDDPKYRDAEGLPRSDSSAKTGTSGSANTSTPSSTQSSFARANASSMSGQSSVLASDPRSSSWGDQSWMWLILGPLT
jgi:phospholipid/cholesterol/gamma-HCH transport system substrate-binding protein